MQGLPIYLTSFFATGTLIYLLSPLSRRIGLVDSPGGHKAHEGQIPLVGGIAMFCGFLFTVLALQQPLFGYRPLFVGSALLVIVGVMDDFKELCPNTRFLAQISAGLIMMLMGDLYLQTLGPLVGTGDIMLGLWTFPFTVFSVVGVINAINMLDGIDGLAGGLSGLAFLVLGGTALSAGQEGAATMLFSLATVTIAFLFFNLRIPWRSRAAVFMGDAGSMFLGFALAWFVIELSQGPSQAIAPVTALWIVAIPLMDTVCIMFRRILKGRSPFLADREHLHHLIQTVGLSSAQSVAVMIGISGLSSSVGLYAFYAGVPDRYLFVAFLVVFGLYYLILDVSWRMIDKKSQTTCTCASKTS